MSGESKKPEGSSFSLSGIQASAGKRHQRKPQAPGALRGRHW